MKLIDFSKRGFSDLLKFFIILNNQFHFTNSIISKIMFFMGQLRNSTYIVYHTQSIPSDYNQIYQFIACIARIQIIAYTQYLFILPFIIIIIFYLAVVYQLVNYEMVKSDQIQQKITLKNFLSKQNKLFRMLNCLMAFFYQFYDTIAVNFIFEISLMQIENQSIFGLTVIFLSLFLYCLFMATRILINTQKLSYIITLIAKFKITYLEIVIHFINYVQIGFYCFFTNNRLYQVTFSFLTAILSFVNIFTNFHHFDLEAYTIIIICQSFTLILSITEYSLIILNFSVKDLGIFQFITLPFVINIFMQLKNKIMTQTIYKKHINNILVFQILYQNLEAHQNHQSMPYILYVRKLHQKACYNCECDQQTQNLDVYLRIITEVSHQSFSPKNYDIVQMILVHLFARNYIQAYSLCSSILEYQNASINEQLAPRFPMKNSAKIPVQKINYLENMNKPMYQFKKTIFCYLREESKQLLKARLTKNMQKQYDIKLIIFEEFYKTEYLIRTMNLKIINVLETKYNLYLDLIKDAIPINQMFQYCYKISNELHQIENTINVLYDENPSMSLLNLKIFYQAEILGNYLQASKEHTVTYEFESEIKQANIVMLAKQNKVAFLITKLGDCVYNVQIERASSNAESFFQAELPKYIEPLIPLGIRDFHGDNLHDFFQTGRSPRYKQNARLFILQNNYIQIAESYLDCYNSLSELRFINIILEVKDIKGHMIVNNKFEVCGINQSLMQMMNYTKSQIEHFNTQEMLYGLNINILIPSFTEMIKENKNIFQTDFYFIRQCYMFDIKKSNMIDRFTNNNLLDRFETQIEISTKYHNDQLAYLILTFDFLKKQNITSLISYADVSSKSNTKYDFQSRIVEAIQVDLPYEFYENYDNELQLYQPDSNFQQLNSPQERSSTYELLTQQKFFNRYNNKKESDDVSIFKKNFSRQYSMPQIQHGFQKNKIDTVLDVATPLKKNKKSKHTNFEDKIECFNQITNKKVNNVFVKLSVFFLVISSTLGIISLLLQTFLIQNNFNNYITDVGILPIKNDLLQPMLSFYILRFNIYDKTELYLNGDISLQEFQNKTDFSFKRIKKVYDHFHHHIGELFSSSVLQDLLYNHYYKVKYYIEDNQSYFYENVSARTFFIQYLEYQHYLYTIYSNNQLPSSSVAVQFQMLNHKLFVDVSSYLSQQIFANTIARNLTQVNDQIIVIACFLSVNFICLLFSNYYYRKFTKQRLFFASMIINVDPFLLENELQNVNFLIDQIENFNISQFYVYDENLKQRQLDQLNQFTKGKQIKYQNKQAVININKFLIFIYSMFFGFLGVNLTNTLILQEFIHKYNPTATVHQNTSELCMNIAMVYSIKELMNNQIFYYFLENSDFEYMTQLLNESFSQIREYQIKLLDLDDNTLLFNSNFVDYFLSQQTKDLCPKINDINDEQVGLICLESFDGSFKLGIQSVLNHITKYMISDVFGDLISQRQVIDTQEIYGAYLFTEYLQTASDMAMMDFSNEVLNYKQILETILITSITFTILLIGIMLYVLESDLKKQLKIALKFIHLIPRYVLFFDHAFERRIRMQILKDINL